jgi:hypothetical protein
MEFTKECMSILLLFDIIFQLWENVFFERGRCNILNWSGDIPTGPSKPIEKSTFWLPYKFKGEATREVNKRIT